MVLNMDKLQKIKLLKDLWKAISLDKEEIKYLFERYIITLIVIFIYMIPISLMAYGLTWVNELINGCI